MGFVRMVSVAAFVGAGLIAWASWGPGLPVPIPVTPTLPVPVPPPVSRVPLPRPPDWPPIRIPKPAPAIVSPVERILIEKEARRMTVFQQDGNPKVFQIALGFAPAGDKRKQGDGKTPEGVFKVDRRNDRSKFTLSLGLDYPRTEDRARARRQGVDPGGDIMIHGQPNQVAEGFKVKGDWTAGCVAVTNPEIREIFAQTKIGTEVEIRP